MKKRGTLAVVSGFSGSGKGTLIKALQGQYSNQYALSISATTRGPREGEEHGREYFFLEKEAFEQMIEDEALLEYANYVGNYYGTPKAYVVEQLEAGKDVILEIEIQGALHVKERFPEALLIFITPPSASVLEQRLRGRGTETEDVIAGRLKRAVEEAEFIKEYDYLLVNDELDACVLNMHQLIQLQHDRVTNNQEFIQQIKLELNTL